MYWTGMRTNDIKLLRWRDINLYENNEHVET